MNFEMNFHFFAIFLMSLKSLLSEARRKKQAEGTSSSGFNFEQPFVEFCPETKDELCDLFSYSEAALFSEWKAAFVALAGQLNVARANERETRQVFFFFFFFFFFLRFIPFRRFCMLFSTSI
jgi:hypothetical protein